LALVGNPAPGVENWLRFVFLLAARRAPVSGSVEGIEMALLFHSARTCRENTKKLIWDFRRFWGLAQYRSCFERQ
jgi:hypothetical protein